MKKLIITILILLLCSCVSKNTKVQKQSDNNLTLESIIILPITTVSNNSDNITYSETKRLEKGSSVLFNLLNEYFQNTKKIRFVTEEQIDANNINFSEARRNQNLAIGKLLKSDGILTLNMNRYLERDGGDYSADQPASVSFNYRLQHTETGQTLCAGVFDETQKTLSDNLLSFKTVFKRGLKWISTEDLAREGINSKFKTCSYF